MARLQIGLLASCFMLCCGVACADDVDAVMSQGSDREQESFSIIADGKQVQVYFYLNDTGEAVYQGDILLGSADKIQDINNNPVTLQSLGGMDLFGNVVNSPSHRWPNGVVRYRLGANLSAGKGDLIKVAMQHWTSQTGIKFEEIAAASGDYAEFVQPINKVTKKAVGGCSSNVGRRGGRQLVYIGADCVLPQIIHEIGHVVGLQHEHVRKDRDKYITINENNIEERGKTNFSKDLSGYKDAGEYCFESLMHYSNKAFAIDKSKDTITVKPGYHPVKVGGAQGLVACDLTTVANLYATELPQH